MALEVEQVIKRFGKNELALCLDDDQLDLLGSSRAEMSQILRELRLAHGRKASIPADEGEQPILPCLRSCL